MAHGAEAMKYTVVLTAAYPPIAREILAGEFDVIEHAAAWSFGCGEVSENLRRGTPNGQRLSGNVLVIQSRGCLATSRAIPPPVYSELQKNSADASKILPMRNPVPRLTRTTAPAISMTRVP